MSSLYNPDYLLSLSQKFGLSPSKKYGQNYLLDDEVISRIIELSSITKSDKVVEVGPGFGVLTFPLAEKAQEVTAFEIEKKLLPYWGNKDVKNLRIVWGNILYEFEKNLPASDYKVIANLPYQITSPVLRLFLESKNKPELMTLMVQKEVAERICAEPGDMSLLAISVQYYAVPKFEFVVPRSSFWPSPEVDSAVVTIRPKKGIAEDAEFFRLVKMGFANKRKLLLKNLEPVIGKKNKEKLKKIFSELNLLPTVRAQELSVEQWQLLKEKIFSI